ncbi:hypothetical protein [Coralloluteibacterium thermophilus]|uniref:Uncharacterized protein n=1 Tax=Coralloluteibacterium thermophilum TaxID=2707049 RepID=A0ABV9NMZ7_9GAMM
MSQVDTFGEYVRRRLDAWGREFALSRDCEYLGHQSKNMLQVLIEHRGEMPPKVVGFKPLETPPLEQQIEDIVADVARTNVAMACALRGYYCGTGRRKVERFEEANRLLYGLTGGVMHVRAYLDLVKRGEEFVRGFLLGLAQAA